MQHVLVTGGTGVTGVALIRYLLEKGIEVTALVREGSKRINYLPEENRLHLINCNMADYKNIYPALKNIKFDVFYHLAWDGSMAKDKIDIRDNMTMQNENVAFAVEAVELCRRIDCPVFVSTGSQAEYGNKSEIISENTAASPENGYGYAKFCAGGMTRILCRKYGIKHIWARLFSVYGPYDGTHSLIYTSIMHLLDNKSPEYTGGEQLWDYLYSFDAAKALYLLAEKGHAGETYCVASGVSRPLHEYIRSIHKIVAPNIEPRLGMRPYAPNQVMSLRADIIKLRQHTGFEPDYSFEQGIHEILQWSIRQKVV